MLTKEQILAAARPRVVEVEVPAWGGMIGLRELSIADVESLTGKNTAEKATSVRLIALSVANAEGERLLSDEEVMALAASRGSEAMGQLVDEIVKLNRLEATAPEDAAKN